MDTQDELGFCCSHVAKSGPSDLRSEFGLELYELHVSVLIVILLFQIVYILCKVE